MQISKQDLTERGFNEAEAMMIINHYSKRIDFAFMCGATKENIVSILITLSNKH